MAKFHKEVTIQAPVEKVFQYLDSPTNLAEVWPSVYEVKDIEALPEGGHRFTYTYNLAGRPSHGSMETFKHVTNERIVEKTTGDIESTYAFMFEGRNGTTKVLLEADFETSTFDKTFEPFVTRWNEYEADAFMGNLKARFELVK